MYSETILSNLAFNLPTGAFASIYVWTQEKNIFIFIFIYYLNITIHNFDLIRLKIKIIIVNNYSVC